MSTLATLPRELQFTILTYLPIEARLHHCDPLTPILLNPNPLFNLSLVSRAFHQLVEDHCSIQLQILNAGQKLGPTPWVRILTATVDYVYILRTHCNICYSTTSVSGSVLGSRTPVCLACDWENWRAKITAEKENILICMFDSTLMLVSREIGAQYNGISVLLIVGKGRLRKYLIPQDFGDFYQVLRRVAVFEKDWTFISKFIPSGEDYMWNIREI